MRHVIFITPYLFGSASRFLDPVMALEGVKVSLVCHQRLEDIPRGYRQRLVGHYKVSNTTDAGQLAVAVKALANTHGFPHRLINFMEELQEAVAKVRDYFKIPGMGYAATRNFRDKAQMKTVLRDNGFPCAKHCLARSKEEAIAFKNQVGLPLILKPPAGAGAKSTFRLETEEMFNQYISVFNPRPEDPALLEEFVQGREFSFEGVSIDGRLAWYSTTRYFPTPLEVLENPYLQWCVLLPREVDSPEFHDIRDLNKRALPTLGMQTGITHMEWFRRDDGSVAISEVAARPPGAQIMSLMGHSTGKPFHQVWAEVMVNGRTEIPERQYAVGVAFLRGLGAGKVKAIHGLDEAQKRVGSVVVEANLPKVGMGRRQGYEGEGWVIVKHPETEVVKKALKILITTIRVEFDS